MSLGTVEEVRKHIKTLDELIEWGFDAMSDDMPEEEEPRFRAATEFWDSIKESLPSLLEKHGGG